MCCGQSTPKKEKPDRPAPAPLPQANTEENKVLKENNFEIPKEIIEQLKKETQKKC